MVFAGCAGLGWKIPGQARNDVEGSGMTREEEGRRGGKRNDEGGRRMTWREGNDREGEQDK